MSERAPDPFRPRDLPEGKRPVPARSIGVMLGVALLVVLANLFVRLSLQSEREREEEERNRERGVWPDEP